MDYQTPVINFLFVNLAERTSYVIFNNTLVNEVGECQLGQVPHPATRRLLVSFLRFRQSILNYIIALLSNLVVNSYFCVLSNHWVASTCVIVKFHMKMATILIDPKILNCHQKHERACPYLSRYFITCTHNVALSLTNKEVNHHNKDVHETGQ